jgi:hypothetical protein
MFSRGPWQARGRWPGPERPGGVQQRPVRRQQPRGCCACPPQPPSTPSFQPTPIPPPAACRSRSTCAARCWRRSAAGCASPAAAGCPAALRSTPWWRRRRRGCAARAPSTRPSTRCGGLWGRRVDGVGRKGRERAVGGSVAGWRQQRRPHGGCCPSSGLRLTASHTPSPPCPHPPPPPKVCELVWVTVDPATCTPNPAMQQLAADLVRCVMELRPRFTTALRIAQAGECGVESGWGWGSGGGLRHGAAAALHDGAARRAGR